MDRWVVQVDRSPLVAQQPQSHAVISWVDMQGPSKSGYTSSTSNDSSCLPSGNEQDAPSFCREGGEDTCHPGMSNLASDSPRPPALQRKNRPKGARNVLEREIKQSLRREKNRMAARKCRAKKVQTFFEMETKERLLLSKQDQLQKQLKLLRHMLYRESKLRAAMKALFTVCWDSGSPHLPAGVTPHDLFVAMENGQIDINAWLANCHRTPPCEPQEAPKHQELSGPSPFATYPPPLMTPQSLKPPPLDAALSPLTPCVSRGGSQMTTGMRTPQLEGGLQSSPHSSASYSHCPLGLGPLSTTLGATTKSHHGTPISRGPALVRNNIQGQCITTGIFPSPEGSQSPQGAASRTTALQGMAPGEPLLGTTVPLDPRLLLEDLYLPTVGSATTVPTTLVVKGEGDQVTEMHVPCLLPSLHTQGSQTAVFAD